MPHTTKVQPKTQSIRRRLVTSFVLIFFTITLYGLYISNATQHIHENLVRTQTYDNQYSLLWTLKYDNRLIAGKARGIINNPLRRDKLRREYDLAVTEYEESTQQLVGALDSQTDLGRLAELTALSNQLRAAEGRGFERIAANDQVGAKVIFDDAYQTQIEDYLDHVDRFLQNRNSNITDSVLSLREQSLTIDLVSFIILALILILILIVFALIHRRIILPIQALSSVAKSFSAGNFGVRALGESSDELGELISTFNNMGDKLQARTAELELAKQNLQADVKRRTEELETKVAELEKFNSFVLNRELKMVELKKELRHLKAAMGQHE